MIMENSNAFDFVTLRLDNVKNIVGNSLTLLIMLHLVGFLVACNAPT